MTTLSLEQYNGLVEAVYEAGLDTDRWAAFCQQLGDVLGGATKIMIQGHDLTTRCHLGTLTANYDPDLADAYDRHFAQLNPWLPGMMSAPMDRIVTDSDLLPRDQLVKTEFWADFVRPLDDMGGGAGAILFREESRLLVLTGNYNWDRQDRHRDGTIRALDLMSGHARRAFRLQRIMEGRELADRNYIAALNAVSNALFLLDAKGRITHCNRSAEKLLEGGKVLAPDRAQVLHCIDPVADKHMHRQIDAVASGAFEILSEGFALRRSEDLRPLAASLFPFHPNREATGVFADFARPVYPVAMLSVVDPARSRKPRGEMLRELYRLTEAEIRLATALAEGRSASDVSQEYGLSIHTVRNQLRSVLEKTGTHRQAELVALLSGLV